MVPTPEEFFESALRNAIAAVDLGTTVSAIVLTPAERTLVELGASAGISAAVDEMVRRDLLDKEKWA